MDCSRFAAELALMLMRIMSGRRADVLLKSSFLERRRSGSVFVLLCNVVSWFGGMEKGLYRGRRWETRKKVTMKVKTRECFNNFCQQRKETLYSVWLTVCVALKNTAGGLESEMRVPTGENSTLLFWGWAKVGRIFRLSGQTLKVHGGRTWLKTWKTLCSASPAGHYHCTRA